MQKDNKIRMLELRTKEQPQQAMNETAKSALRNPNQKKVGEGKIISKEDAEREIIDTVQKRPVKFSEQEVITQPLKDSDLKNKSVSNTPVKSSLKSTPQASSPAKA